MNMSDPIIDSIVNCMTAIKEISPDTFDAITQKMNAAEDEKRQLLQDDQNLAQDMADLQVSISDHDKAISACQREIVNLNAKIKSLNGTRGNLIKKLNNIQRQREDIWKQWNMKKIQPMSFDLNSLLGGIANAH